MGYVDVHTCKNSLSQMLKISAYTDLSFSTSKPCLVLQLPHPQLLTAPPQFPKLSVYFKYAIIMYTKGWQAFFLKGSGSKYFQLFSPDNLCCNDSTLSAVA